MPLGHHFEILNLFLLKAKNWQTYHAYRGIKNIKSIYDLRRVRLASDM
jgi:hypothetical protein